VSRLLEPSRLEPLDVDLRKVLLAGIGCWVVALATVGVLELAGRSTGRAVWVCLAGAALGGWGLLWERGRRPGTGAATPEQTPIA
jgi:hypothetical protein